MAPGAIVGHYQLLRDVAAGGVGSLAQAVDSLTGRIVGIKMLRPEYFDRPGFVEQFEREARVAASIGHPNVAEVYDLLSEGGAFFLVMEFLDHGSLESRIDEGPLGERDLLRIALDVTRGLQAASAKGLLHRDVKPANIVFDAHGRAKLVDFGLAMPVEEARRPRGGVWGSPYYVPPERLAGEPEDFRSDMYSLGATLFHAAAGRPPFRGDTVAMVANKHLKARKASVKTFAPHLSDETIWIIHRCLERQPDNRFASYFELIGALESAQRKALEAPEVLPPSAADVIGGERDAVMSVRWTVLAAVVLIVFGAGALVLFQRRGRQDVLAGTAQSAGSAAKAAPAPAPVPPSAAPEQTLQVVRFTEAEGYSRGDLGAHADWDTTGGCGWDIVSGGGSIIFGTGQGGPGPGVQGGASFLKPIAAVPGTVIQARVRFSFDGFGSIKESEARQVIILCITEKPRDQPSGLHVTLGRDRDKVDTYRLSAKFAKVRGAPLFAMRDIPKAELGDDKDDAGDPSDPLELLVTLRKGEVENGWRFHAVLRNLSNVKDVARLDRDALDVIPEFHAGTEYFGALRSRRTEPRSSRVQVTEWVFGAVRE